MSAQAKEDMSCGGNGINVAPSYPLRKGWQSSRLFNQDLGLPPYLGSREAPRVDWPQRGLAAYSSLGYVPAPLFVPHVAGSLHHPDQKTTKWRVSMDVVHFSPSEISLSLRDEFLEVKGKHEERPDEHGFIARCFTRKYRLPAEVDASKITSTLSVDGILTVEAPVPDTFVPAAIIIPIKVETESSAEQVLREEEEVPQREADCSGAPHRPEFPSSQDQGEEICGDVVQTGNSTAGLQQHEDKRGQEEEEGEKEEEEGENREALMSVPADDEGIQESSSEQYEVLESPESLDASKEADDTEPVEVGEIQVVVGLMEAAETTLPEEQELKGPQSEQQSQQLEAYIQQE